MGKTEEICEALRLLPVQERLRVVERVIHEVAEAAAPATGLRPLGMDTGQGWIAEDFDGPLPDDVQKLFDDEL